MKMNNAVLSLCLLVFTVNEMNAQMDARCEYSHSFWNAEKIIVVKGKNVDKSYKETQDWFSRTSQNRNKFIIKNEEELQPKDLKEHLFFFGPINSYANLSKYLPSALAVSKNGFFIGPYKFTDSMDVISLFSSDSLYLYQIGNSYTAITSLWSTFNEISQYLIMQKYAITHHGSLSNNKFDSSKHFDVVELRKKELVKYETQYYNFYYPPSFFNDGNEKEIFLEEDKKLDRAIKILNLVPPQRKIECFIYNDIQQKYHLSATPGYGNPFAFAWQNHTIGLGATEHESIHILWINQIGKATFFNEGVVGFYNITVDINAWKKNRIYMLQHPDIQIKELLTGTKQFDFSDDAYAASANFVKFFVDTYSLDLLKKVCKVAKVDTAFSQILNKSVDQIIEEWKLYAERTKIKLGPERKITFKVLPKIMPDSSTIYIIGAGNDLGNWFEPKPLRKEADGSWSVTFSFKQGLILEYKIHRGSFDKEAITENGVVPGNSILEVVEDKTISIIVANWKDTYLKQSR